MIATREKLRARALEQWRDPVRRARILAGQRARRLFNENLGLATWMARRYEWTTLDFDDLRQTALMGLHTAVQKFDPERGARFSTVAYWYMSSAIQKEIAATRSVVRAPVTRAKPVAVSLDAPVFEDASLGSLLPSVDEEGPEVLAERGLMRERVGEALATLPERDAEIIRLRMGFEAGPMTLEAIGARLGITRERVRQIEGRALERLRFRLPKP